MLAVFVQHQQLCNDPAANLAHDEHIQPAVIRLCLRPGHKAAAVGAAVAHRAHQAVHGQHLAVNDVLHPAADMPAQLLDNGQRIGRLAAAQRDAPELGDAVGYLCVQTGGADGGRKPQTGAHQVDGHCSTGQLSVQIQELLFCTVGA